RSLAARQVSGGHVRVNGTRVAKPAFAIGPDDVLTFTQAHEVRVIRVLAPGDRRGPAPEARALYDDLSPPSKRESIPPNPKYEGKGRPTKRDRRKLDRKDPGALD
ncbi:MAG: S4 domain-containing protein, partial [Roseovarius sp.]|nr:S4 domain-containing protein [Roseovarius sp.]